MKTPEDDFFLGHTVLVRKTVSREALLECLFQMSQERKAGVPRPLGVLLVSHGHLTQEDLDAVLAARVSNAGSDATISEAEVGRLLVAAGLISRENVEECVRLQTPEEPVPPSRLGLVHLTLAGVAEPRLDGPGGACGHHSPQRVGDGEGQPGCLLGDDDVGGESPHGPLRAQRGCVRAPAAQCAEQLCPLSAMDGPGLS